MADDSVNLRLSGRLSDLRLPTLLVGSTRSGGGPADPFLPPGYLEPRQAFDVLPPSRAAGVEEQAHGAASDEVIVLELADGAVLITSAGRLQATLARTHPEMLDANGAILLDRLSGAGAAASRGLLDSIGGLVSKVFAFTVGARPDAILSEARAAVAEPAELGVSWLGTKALMAAIEKRLDRAPGLYRWRGASGQAQDLEVVEFTQAEVSVTDAARVPMLVFVHGTGSSTLGSFGDLRNGDRELWSALERQFPGGIYGFEHRTLSQSPIDNAIQLLQALPKGAHVSLVSHSRGGLVADLLCLDRFDELIDRYSYAFEGTGDADPAEAKRVIGELDKAHAEQRAQLRVLARLLRDRRIVVQRYVRAASPANGTKLASGNFDLFLSGLLTLIGQVPLFFGSPFYSAFKRVVIEIAKNRTNAHLVPGIEAMLPDSPMARLLRDAPVCDGITMAVIAGDIEGRGLLQRLGVLLTDFLLFDSDDNDLVVNTTSMLAGIASAAQARVLFDRGSDVSHFRYFANADTRAALRDWLVVAEPRGLDVFRPLPSPDEYAAALAAAQKSRGTAESAALPIVVVLPGVMGSHLQANGNDRVWFDPADIATGGLQKIAWGQPAIEAEDLFGMFYGKLCEELARTHRVERFAYDWRQPLDVLGERLGEFLDRLLKESDKPVRLLAHSMGGLVVRACLHKRGPVMDALMKRPGARLVMLGTPHQGAHSMVENLLGKGDTLRTLVRLDLTHSMQEVLDIVSGFRGALQLLPKPGFVDTFQGQTDGGAFFPFQQAATWTDFRPKQRDFWFGDGRVATPSQKVLDSASWLWTQDGPKPPVLPEAYEAKSIYVFGVARNTPCGVREEGGRLRMVGTTRGDGTVTWESGRIGGIGSFYYMPVSHGDLPSTERYFGALVDLLAAGATTGLDTHAPATRSAESEQPISYDPGPPTVDDADALTRGLMGSSVGTRVPRQLKYRLEVNVRAMDLRSARSPIMVGQYEQDPIAGPQQLIDRDLLSGALTERYNLGVYPGPIGTAMVVFGSFAGHGGNGVPRSGAIVAGLGKYDGTLSPSQLTDAVRSAVMRYLLQLSERLGDEPRALPLSTLLIGYNSALNFTIAASVESLVRGVLEANAKFAAVTRSDIRIGHLDIVELYLDTAISAAYELRRVGQRLKPLATQYGTLLICDGEFKQNASVRPRLYGNVTQSYWPRLMITEGASDAAGAASAANAASATADTGAARLAVGERLRFLYVGQRARAESTMLQRQPGLIEAIVRQQIRSAQWREEFGRMLFQLLVPNDFKDAARQLDRIVLVVDAYTANLPWELMLADDPVERSGEALQQAHKPLALRAPVVRQFATTSFRRHVRQSPKRSALVVGNPSTAGFETRFVDGRGQPCPALLDLSGAGDEARAIGSLLRNFDYEVQELVDRRDADATAVLSALYRQPWRLLHISAHGVFNQRHVDGGFRSGVVLSDGLLITAAEIEAMEVVPDLVFLNCCHLATIDVGDQGNKLAASIARELIDIGVRCVVVAGWAVDDVVAQTFGEEFYGALLHDRLNFGQAIFRAREAAWIKGQCVDITWGAFQAYGDPGWQADPGVHHDARDRKPEMFVVVDEVCDELTRRKNDLLRRDYDPSWKEVDAQVAEVEQMVRDRCPLGWRQEPKLLLALGEYYRELGHLSKAYEVFFAAVRSGEHGADVSLRIFEEMAKIEARFGEWRAEFGPAVDPAHWVEDGERLFELALQRFDALDALAGLRDQADPQSPRNIRRDALRGSAWKRKASLHARQLLRGPLAPRQRDLASAKMMEALSNSIEAYRSAEGFPGGPDFQLYHALNRLTLDAFTTWDSPASLDAAVQLAQRCREFAQDLADRLDDPWDAMAPGDAMLAELLLRGTLGRAGVEGDAALEGLQAHYDDGLSRAATERAIVYGLVQQLEIMSRLSDAVALSRFRDESWIRTADRLLQLVQHLQPRRPPRTDRLPALVDAVAAPQRRPAAKKKAAATRAGTTKPVAKKAPPKKPPPKKKPNA